MKRFNHIIAACLVLFFFANGCTKKDNRFIDLPKIDAHFHVRYNGPEFLDQAVKDNFKIVAIITDHYDLVEQENFILHQWQHHPKQLLYITAFSMQGWEKPDWQEKTISWLNSAFAKGAAGVKVWKDIGMEYKDKDGNFIMIDNPRFDPVFDYIESQNKTLTAHIGEPKDCWLPLDEMIAESNRDYYSSHPEYHMYLHPEYPSYEDQIHAMEHVLEKHPHIRYVGCHLASMEWSPQMLGKFLDKFPNTAVDMGARIDDLQYLDQTEVRELFVKYQDRLLYGTDEGIKANQDPIAFSEKVHKIWLNDWKYLCTDSIVTIHNTQTKVRGLNLPQHVLEKIYFKNAQKWYKWQ